MRIFMVLITMLFSLTAYSAVPLASLTMLSGATTTATSESFLIVSGTKNFYARGTTSSGAGSAVIAIEGTGPDSSVTGDWVNLATITLTLGVTSTGDGFVSTANWAHTRARITTLTGTGAAVTITATSETMR